MIKAEVVAASKCQTKIATVKVSMPRYILAETKTHRILSDTDEGTEILVIPGGGINDDNNLSRNSASSRAIRIDKMLRSAMETPFIPFAWQKSHTGMQGSEYFTNEVFGESETIPMTEAFKSFWLLQRQEACTGVGILDKMGLTKQLANRLLEPFIYHTVLITATEWENFFNLRCPVYTWHWDDHRVETYKSKKELIAAGVPYLKEFENDPLYWLSLNKGQADIHMMAVAEAIYDAYNEAEFKELAPGEWHMPYGDQINIHDLTTALYKLNNESFLINQSIIEQAKIEISIARCARLSYQTLGDNPKIDYAADLKLYNALRQSKHWSPFEHVAKAMAISEWDNCIKTIINKDGSFVNEFGWLANFKGWIQQRAILENLS